MYENGKNGKDQPYWLEDGKVNDLKFLESMRQFSYFRVVAGVFYDGGEHRIEDSAMKSMIVDELSRGTSHGLNRKAKDLLELMRYRWEVTTQDKNEDLIHVVNGTVTSGGKFSEDRDFTTHRLRAFYGQDLGKPERFLQYLEELLEPEDIPTLQEYMGYCLIPSTRGQKMLVISGKGGEGKSVLGEVMARIWGDSLMFGSIQKIATDRFARATLMQRLVMVDDDMSLEALTQTHLLKTLVTLKGKTDVEVKGQQSFQAELYARFIGFTNGSLSALYDRSYGFYRRMILLKTRDRPNNRVDYPYLGEAMVDCERDEIFMWCLEGLLRLMDQNFQFTISPHARKNLEEAMKEADPILEFLESEGYFVYDHQGYITSADLFELYKKFCEDNALAEPNKRTAQRRLKEQLGKRGIQPVTHVPQYKTKSVRGFCGIRLLQPVRWIA